MDYPPRIERKFFKNSARHNDFRNQKNSKE
jgi:hypothetical protein